MEDLNAYRALKDYAKEPMGEIPQETRLDRIVIRGKMIWSSIIKRSEQPESPLASVIELDDDLRLKLEERRWRRGH